MVNLRFGHGVPKKNISNLSKRLLAELLQDVNATQQATSTPTPEPEPEPEHRSEIPEIDGSHAAFVGLMVALSVIIVVCCCLVYHLLRNRPREGDSIRGLYTKPKENLALAQMNKEFDSDSEDDDNVQKKGSRRRDVETGSGNKPSTPGQAQGALRLNSDTFDPVELQASVQKFGSSASPAV